MVRNSAVAVALAGSACVITGIEPDEIDVADDGEAAESDLGTEGEAGGTEGENTSDTGDGETTGTGDGDGDPSSTGDGDGDPTTGGDGDGDGDSCLGFAPTELMEGENAVEIVEGASALSSSCGGAGPETVYQFVAPSEGTWSFAITQAEFIEVLTLVSACVPVEEINCSETPASVDAYLLQGQIVYVIVDSESGVGPGTLVISQG